MMKNKWFISDKKADFKYLMEQFHMSEILARCLVNRGITEHDAIHKFLNPRIGDLYSPFLMKDMNKACDILMENIYHNKKIRIIGDYDVDGIISTYILYDSLSKMGANVDYMIPNRIEDGYGIQMDMVEDAYHQGIDTILTCDNGISAIEQIHKAKSYGITVIITDHHDIYKENDISIIPNADAVVNPKQEDCKYPFKGLCGAAITYKLMIALMEQLKEKNQGSNHNNNDICPLNLNTMEIMKEELLSFAAIATVCDIMDLIDENRIIVKSGLEILKENNNLGLNALINVNNLSKEGLSAYQLGFVIGPCLNASGRLDTAVKGLKLLLTDSPSEANELSNELRILNDLRKDMTAKGVEDAIEQVENSSLKEDKILVVYLPNSHESLAGIIAGRIKEKYYKPTIVLTDSKDCVKGSARSIEEYNIYEEINQCRNLLLKFGGHPMAAGMSLKKENIDLLRKFLNENTELTEEMLMAKVNVDVKLPLAYLSEDLVEELNLLEPFGKGNPKPTFAQKDIIIKSIMLIGKNRNAMKLKLISEIGTEIEALYFGDVEEFFEYIKRKYGEEEVNNMKNGKFINAKLTIAYYPNINIYKNMRNLQIIIQNYR